MTKKRVCYYLPFKLIAKVKRQAKKEKTTMSDVIAQLVTNHIE